MKPQKILRNLLENGQIIPPGDHLTLEHGKPYRKYNPSVIFELSNMEKNTIRPIETMSRIWSQKNAVISILKKHGMMRENKQTPVEVIFCLMLQMTVSMIIELLNLAPAIL